MNTDTNGPETPAVDPLDYARWRSRLQAVTDEHHLVKAVGASVQWSPLVDKESNEHLGLRAAVTLGPASPTVVHNIELGDVAKAVDQGLAAEDVSFTRAMGPLVDEALVIGLATLLHGLLDGMSQARKGSLEMADFPLGRAQRRALLRRH